MNTNIPLNKTRTQNRDDRHGSDTSVLKLQVGPAWVSKGPNIIQIFSALSSRNKYFVTLLPKTGKKTLHAALFQPGLENHIQMPLNPGN